MNTGFPSMFPQPPIPDFTMPPPGAGMCVTVVFLGFWSERPN